jgi:hypothetical protein
MPSWELLLITGKVYGDSLRHWEGLEAPVALSEHHKPGHPYCTTSLVASAILN